MRIGIASCVMLLLFVSLHAAIVDRIVITVDREVITALQLEEEIRVTAFIEHGQPNFELESRRQAADRLVEQVLVKREMQLSRYPGPGEADVTAYLDTIIKSYGGEASFRSSLARAGLSEGVAVGDITTGRADCAGGDPATFGYSDWLVNQMTFRIGRMFG